MIKVIKQALTAPLPLQAVITTVIAGMVMAFLQIMLGFSLASILFFGELEPYLAQGLGLILFSMGVSIAVFAVLSNHYQLFPSQQSSLLIILASISASIVIAPNKAIFPTMLVVISLTAIILGVVLFLFGHYKLTKFIRYVPYPVIGGFLAGNGWLLIKGALGVMTSSTLTLANFNTLFSADAIILWLPGVMIAIILFVALRMQDSTLLLPLILGIGVVVIYGILAATGTSYHTASAQGILIGNIGDIQWRPPTAIAFAVVDWSAIVSEAGHIITLIMVALIHLPLNLTGIELIKHKDLDIDDEVRSNGIMNLIVGILGGTVNFSSTTMTAMNHRLNGANRYVYAIAAVAILGVLFLGSAILTRVPVAVLGGLLIFLGMDFIDTWMVQGYRKFTRLEYAVVLLIMVTVVFVGFLEGIVLGIFVMVLVFVATYSRISIIYRSTSARNLSSAVEHNPRFADELTRLRSKVYVLELTGFLFFGTADGIVNEVKARLEDSENYELRYLIIDFRRVAGVDSSALMSLDKVLMLAATQDFDVIFSNFEDNASVARIVQDLSESERLEFAPDLDRALERCEELLLDSAGTTKGHISSVIWMQLVDMGMNKDHAKKMSQYMERQQYVPDDVLVLQGDAADRLFFIEIGRVSIFLNYDSEKPIRLRSIGMGTIVGEIAFFLDADRSATVVADLHTFAWCLTKESLERMKAENPELAFAFEAMILRIVAKRLTTSNHLLEVLR